MENKEAKTRTTTRKKTTDQEVLKPEEKENTRETTTAAKKTTTPRKKTVKDQEINGAVEAPLIEKADPLKNNTAKSSSEDVKEEKDIKKKEPVRRTASGRKTTSSKTASKKTVLSENPIEKKDDSSVLEKGEPVKKTRQRKKTEKAEATSDNQQENDLNMMEHETEKEPISNPDIDVYPGGLYPDDAKSNTQEESLLKREIEDAVVEKSDSSFKPEERKMNLISIIGAERGDFSYHLAGLLSKTGTKGILLIDNSLSKDLFGSIRKLDSEKYAYFEDVTVAEDKLFSPDVFSIFDYVIVYHGMTVDEEILSASSQIILLNDYLPETMDFMNSCSEWLNGSLIVYLGRATSKIKERLLPKLSGIKAEDILIVSEDSQDRAGYLLFRHNGRHSLKNMSTEYRESVVSIASKITGIADKKIRKNMKK